MMTEAEAWRVIARAYVEGKTMAKGGLCCAVGDLHRKGHLFPRRRDAMWGRIDVYLGPDVWAYEPIESRVETKWGVDYQEDYSQDREARCLAALWLAEEAEAEA